MALTKISGSILKDPLNLGEVSIGGTLTYQDVTNVDSVGIITARSGIDCNGTLEVSSTSNFDGAVQIADTILHLGDTNTKIRFPAADTISFETAGSERLRITSGGQLNVGSNIKLGAAGIVTATTFVGNLTGEASALGSSVFASGPFNNRIVTTTGGNNLNPEIGLQFDGTRLGIGGAPNNIALDVTKNTQGGIRITDTAVTNASYELRTQTGNSTKMFRIIDVSANSDRLQITSGGQLNVGSNIKLGAAGIVTATAFVPTTQLSHRNILHNGEFKVIQRYGTSFTINSDADNEFTFDRWYVGTHNNLGDFTVSQ